MGVRDENLRPAIFSGEPVDNPPLAVDALVVGAPGPVAVESDSIGTIDVTVVVPTRHETENIAELVHRVDQALGDCRAEILFVDDSDDGTPDAIRAIMATTTRPIRLLHREPGRREGRLGGAVTAGFQLARGTWGIVIDADLQHPPEVLADFVRRIATAEDDLDLIYGNRYDDSGSFDGLSGWSRRLVSQGSTLLVKGAFPRRLEKVSDPMSGLFAVRLGALDLTSLRPHGYKIMLEIIARSTIRRTEGIPYHFQPRHAGDSKASLGEGMRFLAHVLALRCGLSVEQLGRLFGFLLVGASGVVVNTAVLWGLTSAPLSVAYPVASVVATSVAIGWNFLLLRHAVYRARRSHQVWREFGRFWLLNQLLLPVQLGLLVLSVEVFGVSPVPANIVVLVAVVALRFMVTSRWVFPETPFRRRSRGRHFPARNRFGRRIAPTATHAVTPPNDEEKYHYLLGPQHRWFFWAHVVALAGVAVSMYGFARMSYWTMVMLLPLAVYVFEVILGVRSSTFRRTVSLTDHRALIELRGDRPWPSIDVYLPTAGEPLDILTNTYGHVSRMEYPGVLRVYVLDDMGRPEVRAAAADFGFDYFARPGSAFKKAGNLQYAFERTDGDAVIIFDADFVPRIDFATELIPYLDDESVGIVQSPQVFETSRAMHWLERSAGATQEMFYRFIQPSRNAVGAAICVGTSAIYRRQALAAIGGFPQISHSEDVYTGFDMAAAGYRVQYVQLCLSRGICPDSIDSYISQQYRWCEGSMEMVRSADFHRQPTMTLDQRISFWSGFVYYFSTAMNAFLAPLPAIAMFWLFPQEVRLANYLPLLGLAALWLVIYPLLMKGRWRVDVLRVQAIYGFTHAVAIWDVFFGRTSEWVPSHGSAGAPTPLAVRVRTLTAVYVGITQLAVVAGIAVHLADPGRYSALNWSAAIAFAVLNLYVFGPVWWMSVRPGWQRFVAARRTPALVPAESGVS